MTALIDASTLDAPLLETARLRLSPYTEADADALVANANHAQVARMMATVPLPFTRADALARIAARGCDGDRFTLAIRGRQTGEAIGEIGAASASGSGVLAGDRAS